MINDVIIDEFGAEYSADKKRLIKIPAGLSEYEIIEGTEIIEEKAFNHSELELLYIPKSVTNIKIQNDLRRPDIAKIVVDKNNTVYDSRNNCNAIIKTKTNTLIYGCKTTVIPSSVITIGAYAFYYCSKLASIVIPDSIVNIESFAFEGCDELTTLVLPDSVVSIGQEAFARCEKLNCVVMPNGLKEVGTWMEDEEIYDIFYDCEELKTIYIPKGTLQNYLKVIPNHDEAFKYKED